MRHLLFPLLALACSQDKNPSDTADIDAMDDNWHSDCPTHEAETRMIETNGIQLNVACRGSGPTVLFLHGFPEFWYEWDKVMDLLAEDYRLIAPDQRGYNLSDKPEDVEAYKIDVLVEDIAQLIPQISPEKLILVAHDWGGPIGWHLAHSESENIRAFLGLNAPHPNRFAELLSTDPAQQAASQYMGFFRSDGAETLLAANDYAGLVDTFDGALTEDDIPLYKDAWAQPGALTGGLNWYRANDLGEGWDTDPITVEIPTRVLWGEDDSAVLVSNAEGLDTYVSDLDVTIVPGVDHWIAHRIPAQIADAIRNLDETSHE